MKIKKEKENIERRKKELPIEKKESKSHNEE